MYVCWGFFPLGIPTQIPASSLMPGPATGPDSIVSQAQVTSASVAGVPVWLQAVNQPLMPLPQTLNPYQDPLYPGFPFNEKGERAVAPPYSLCSTGEDLPKGEKSGFYTIFPDRSSFLKMQISTTFFGPVVILCQKIQ